MYIISKNICYLFLTYFTLYDSLWSHPYLYKGPSFIPFYDWVIVHCRRRQWHPTPVLWPGKSHGWRSLEVCSPWGHWGSDRTEQLHFHFSLSCIGEGNGNPLQYSCLENPRDGEAWWAAIYEVTQSWIQLKWLSNSKIVHCIYVPHLLYLLIHICEI